MVASLWHCGCTYTDWSSVACFCWQVCIEGGLKVNTVALSKHDALEAVNHSDSENLPLALESGPDGSHFLLIEMRRA